jgi:hypothetical protein
MKKDNLPIFWRGKIVGHISELKIDNFDVYGKWVVGKELDTNGFLAEIEGAGCAIISIGSIDPVWLGTVEFLPDDEIEIKIRPNLEEGWNKNLIE